MVGVMDYYVNKTNEWKKKLCVGGVSYIDCKYIYANDILTYLFNCENIRRHFTHVTTLCVMENRWMALRIYLIKSKLVSHLQPINIIENDDNVGVDCLSGYVNIHNWRYYVQLTQKYYAKSRPDASNQNLHTGQKRWMTLMKHFSVEATVVMMILATIRNNPHVPKNFHLTKMYLIFGWAD